ncbi:MAG: hypothetical protein AAF791_15295 [Bacteroidota bacterium]
MNRLLFTLALVLALPLTACDSGDPDVTPPPPATTGTVTGTITLPPGAPGDINNARVALYTDLINFNNDVFAYNTGVQGTSYTIGNIVPGNYFLDVWKDTNNNNVIDTGDLYNYWGSTGQAGVPPTPVSIAAGQTATVSFQVVTVTPLMEQEIAERLASATE